MLLIYNQEHIVLKSPQQVLGSCIKVVNAKEYSHECKYLEKCPCNNFDNSGKKSFLRYQSFDVIVQNSSLRLE